MEGRRDHRTKRDLIKCCESLEKKFLCDILLKMKKKEKNSGVEKRRRALQKELT